MSDQPHDEDPSAFGGGDETPADQDKTIHLAGAGTIGMTILIVSLSILFVASMVAVLAIRAQAAQWPPAGAPRVPQSLWISTLIILCASVTVQLAHNAVRRDEIAKTGRYLLATALIGAIFLGMQSFNWIEYFHEIIKLAKPEGPYMGMFFVLTGLHAAHVIGGLIPLAVVIHNARIGRYSRNFHPGVRYVAVYWHFLDVIWVVLFLVIYF